jgi:hypothetical protein
MIARPLTFPTPAMFPTTVGSTNINQAIADKRRYRKVLPPYHMAERNALLCPLWSRSPILQSREFARPL